MTSRLKRKLNDLEPTSNLNESFCMIGTPLPALADTKKDKGEFVPVWKQEVRDEQGRRRLHGAFTGGFSAGYFNTVGSKEGWTPSTFTSSRNQRAQPTQRAEDFMDEEDLAELREGQKIETKSGFGLDEVVSSAAGSKKEGDLSSFFTSLIQPSSSNIGDTILTKLGWRPGQGIGPRITARALRLAERKENPNAVVDDPEEGDEVGEDSEAKKHLFAPRDTKLLLFDQKEGSEGLGWIKGDGLKKTDHMDQKDNSRFAYEDEDDDEDLMRLGSTSTRSSYTSSHPSFPTASSSTVSTWHDGRPAIRGFIVASQPILEDKWFDPPAMPAGWTPKPSRVWNRGRKWDVTVVGATLPEDKGKGREAISGEDAWKRRQAMTANDRGVALGESTAQPSAPSSTEPVVPNAAKSVFEYLSAKDRERLASLSSASASSLKPNASEATSVARPSVPILPALDTPTVDAVTANSALHGYMPFVDDPGKQARYRAYLSSQSTQSDPTGVLQPQPGQSASAHYRELSDFQKAAQMFRPMSFSMANRFTSSSQPIIEGPSAKAGLFVMTPEAKASLAQAKAEREAEEEADRSKVKIPENETPVQQAARMGMYGPLTRTTAEFFPVKLVCKRFGVADPRPEGPKDSSDAGAFVEPGSNGAGSSSGAGATPVDPNAWQTRFTHVVDAAAVGSAEEKNAKPKEEEPSVNLEIETQARPSMDIFKAVFASDAEDSDSDSDSDLAPPPPPSRPTAPTHSDPTQPSFQTQTQSAPVRSTLPALTDSTGFKPTFTSKLDRQTTSTASTNSDPVRSGKSGKNGTGNGKSKSKSKRKAVLSFMDGEEEEDETGEENKEERERERKARREERKRKRAEEDRLAAAVDPAAGDEEEEVWVEKPSEAVRLGGGASGTVGKRQKALDFM
ncbi:Predicted RNA binding protein, contains G-patch domain [Phaffia rhodozyma]|uniref:Predicted RNA binding protein, contains G-patch domain n=1 Tax=Phaffia rhodozyma TaxID=264483 RepID=A0A0F7SS06_PHARH|nr:Predicted RNA binding protein, contains G-patch domain [Phaffia rhodozyma]